MDHKEQKFQQRLTKALQNTPQIPILSVRLYEQAGAKEELLAESYQPQPGIYYWIPLGDKDWALLPFWAEFYGDKVVHFEVWRKYIAKELTQKFDCIGKLEQLQRHPYGLPRGRILKNPQKYYLWHGGDTPVENGIQQVMEEFNLTIENTEILQHPHEEPRQSDVKVVKEILKYDYFNKC